LAEDAYFLLLLLYKPALQAIRKEFDHGNQWILMYDTSQNTQFQLPCCGIS
jgi:hypothetical protein